jgi:hypothetical protein
LLRDWREHTSASSSLTEMCVHPAYQRIIGMGPRALPLIFRELENQPDHLFWALKAITGADPVPPAQRGKLKEMAQSWLTWGKQQGYQWTSKLGQLEDIEHDLEGLTGAF